MNYRVRKNRIIFENGRHINFEYRIKESVEVDDVIVVVLNKPAKHIFPNNAFAIKKEKILWQIESKNPPSTLNVYIGVDSGNGEVFLINYLGFYDVVDIQTGKIKRSYETR